MKNLQIRERASLRRTVRSYVAQLVASEYAKAKEKESKVDIIFRSACPRARAKLRNRMKRLGIWDQVRNQLAWDQYDRLLLFEYRRRVRLLPDPAQSYFPDFDALPAIRIQ